MEKPMHHAPAPAAVGKVSQIANIFQRKPIEIQPVEQLTAVAAAHAAASAGGGAPSHSARFNNARALFEKLGVESNSNVSSRLLRSGSREDNLCDGSDRSSSRSSDRSQSPPKRRTPFPSGVSLIHNNNNASVAAQNGSPEQRLSNSKFIVEPSSQTPPTSVVKYPQHNLSRLKTSGGEEVTPTPPTGGSVSALFASSGADKPEKPERKFNSRELIEKQKKWTSHFTKTKTTRTHSDLNRCDIIRTVPGTGLIMDSGEKATAKPAMEPPNASPNPPMRHAPNQTPPEIKPRSGKIGSPVKSPPLPPIPAVKPKNVSPVKFNPDRVRSSPTKSAVEPSPPPPPAKSAAVTAAMQRSLLQEQQQQNTQAAPIPPEKPRKKSIDLIEDQTPNLSTNCSTSSSCTSPTSSASNSAYIMQAAKRGSLDAAATGHGNGLSGSTNSAASCSPVASASSGPSSPVHTEDEKQENESTEKSELMEHYHNNNYNSVPRRRRSENEGRKSVDESTAASQQQQQHSSNIGSSSSSPQRVANKRSSIILQMPAAGLGQRPPSIISTASNQDEGELKAKGLQGESLEEQQQHHSLHYVDVGYRLNPDGSETREVYGSETELYDTAKVTDMQRKFHGANGFAQETSTVYAIIKTDLQEGTPAAPPRGLLQSPSADGSPLHRVAYNSPPVGVVSPIRRRNNQEHSGGGGSAKSTPPISPARTALVKGIAPIASIDAHDEEEELDLDDDDEEEEDEHLTVEYVEVREMHKQQQQQQEEEEAPVLPERRAPTQGGGGISLEMQEDLEYADTSAGEDEEDILNHLGMIPGNDSLDSVELMDDVVDEVIKVHVNHSVATAIPPSLMGGSSAAPAAPAAPAAASSVAPVAAAAAIPREDSLPDDMTAAEAERLLSSSILESKIRQQSLLSDEQAKEVEQILNAAAPSVGVTVAAVVATATSPTSIKNLIEEPLQSVANGEQQQDIQIAAVPAIVEEEEPPYEQEEEELQPRYGDEEEEPYEVYDADADADADANGDGEEDSDDVEAVDIVGYGQASAALNATFIKADSTETETTTTTPSTTTTATAATAATASTTANTRHDNDDEPEWLRDVLEAPKRSLENLLITSVGTAASAAAAAVGREREAADLENGYKHSDLNHTYVTSGGESLHESIVSVDSTQSDATLNQTTTIDDSIISSKHNSTYSLDQAEPVTNSTVLSTGITELDDSQYYIPEYPPVRSKEVLVEAGVHYFEDGNFWMEVPGLLDFDDDDCSYPPITVRKNPKVRFSSGPIHVYSTFSVNDYDRRNEDVDPVAASAEYELEKRVEKMHVFPVELMKGPEGLGLSIIGMGVGADAGLEKLGIFVKTITDNGAAARDGRIQVNDQIIEVDGKSLVGVTQAYAASVLRNTSGLVKFQIGRERDPENSEVAQLIRLSLQADREKEERLKRSLFYSQQEEYLRRTLDYSEDSTQPVSANSSVCEGPSSPVQVEHPMEVEATHSQEVESLKRLLQESEMGCLVKEEIIQNLKRKLVKLETTGNENELLSERLRQSERELGNIRKEAANLQNMLQQSQGQYMALDKKYNKAKRLVREYQQRELDTCHREEFYQQLMRENDNEYNALVKKLKDRVINLEHELQETQRKAGFPVGLPYDSATLKLTPQMMRKAPPKPLFHKLETELSDTEISDLSPDGDGVKTATVERKVPVKDELDAAVPQHELLDNSVNKTKIDLANRQLPSANGANGNGNSNSGTADLGQLSNGNLMKRSRSNSRSSDCTLDDTDDDEVEDEEEAEGSALNLAGAITSSSHDTTITSLSNGNSHLLANVNNLLQHHPPAMATVTTTAVGPSNGHLGTTTAILLNSTSSSSSSSNQSTTREAQINQLYAQVHKDPSKQQQQQQQQQQAIVTSVPVSGSIPSIFKNALGSPADNGGGLGLNDFHRGSMTTFGTGPASSSSNRDLNSSYDSILGSNDKLSENEPAENWMYPSRRRVAPNGGSKVPLPGATFTDQLNQALTDRERRLGDGSSRHSSDDYTEINKSQSASLAAINCKTLINEIRQAVNEAQPKVKQVVPQSLSPPGTVPWQQQHHQQQQQQQLQLQQQQSLQHLPQSAHATGPPSPTSMSSGCSSPGYSPSRTLDLSGSSSSFSDRKVAAAGYNYKGGPVHEWTKDQVGHWLMGIELERYIPVFKEHNVEGGALLTLDSKDFKTLGVCGDDKHRLKKRLKDLKANIEKERKDMERERREREKAIRKAEKKLAKKK
ncbi:uncharacterized protein LOC6601183 isoform X3 [Drosophila persimilis]|uniref:uncharacterized protein LOC6601183 isoform X3 n=1 Tax=Drosophila persimilis TaxID=7234 RepID=UPI000F08F27C|nr:uncharacterized protein LOC6601183 isoform X3 [Drosophila persimilis]